MKNLKIWLKMTIGIGLLLLLIIVNGGWSIRSLKNIDNQIQAIQSIFMPLAESSSAAQIATTNIPAAMNTYLLSGKPEHWQQAQAALNNSEKAIDQLQKQVYGVSAVPNSLAEQTKAAFQTYAQAVQDAHSNNDSFIKQRNEMTAIGKEVGDIALNYKIDMIRRLRVAVDDGNAPEVESILTRMTLIDTISNQINDLRILMLRSLAEQNSRYAQSNITQLFPKVLSNIDKLIAVISDSANLTRIQDMRAKTIVFRDFQDQVLKAWANNGEISTKRDATRAAVLQATSSITQETAKAQRAAVDAVVQESATSYNVTVVVMLVIILLGALLGVILSRAISGPVGKALAFAQSVAGGELSRRLRLNQRDEIGQLSVALDSMVDTLNEKISEATAKSEEAVAKEREALKAMESAESAGAEAKSKTQAMLAAADKLEEVADIVSSASSELSAQIEQSERGAMEQASRVTETATAMEEMNSTVLEVAKNAGQASEVSATTRKKAEEGSVVVRRAVSSIQFVQEQSLALKNDMGTLAEHAQSISKIMGVISDIADQTNLLALNAAIEAARAGEAGRGFAVVADEVRKLAENTMAATTDVGNAIKAIQQSADKSMRQVDEAVKSIEEATGLSSESGNALAEIVKMADSTADQVRGIAAASEQQSASSEEINRSIAQVNTIATETARAMAEAARVVMNLTEQANVLSRLIDDMKRS